jgi:hypothetical protein
MPAPNLGEIVTSTLRARSGKAIKQFERNTALMTKLTKKGNSKPFSGGRSIVTELEYRANDTVKRYSGYEQLDIRPNEVFTGAEYFLKQLAVAVTISGLEELTNAGDAQVIDLMEGRISNAEASLMLTLSADTYSDGTADGGKQMGGLQHLVSDTGLGMVGGIDSANWDFWRNQVYSAAALALGVVSSTNIQTIMNRAYLGTSKNRDMVDLIVADNNYFRYYLESLQAIQRITATSEAEAGFATLKFMGADVMFDGGFQGDAPADRMYFLKTKHIKYRPHKDRNMVPLDPTRHSTNQDATVRLIAHAANYTIGNRQEQAVIKP